MVPSRGFRILYFNYFLVCILTNFNLLLKKKEEDRGFLNKYKIAEKGTSEYL